MTVCVDAGLIASAILDEPLSEEARRLLASWIDNEVELLAPDLWAYEVVATTHKAILRGNLPPGRRIHVLRAFFNQDVSLVRPPGIHERAADLAALLGLPATYDAHYLALAESEGIEFWTADQRLYNAVHDSLPWVHWLGEA